MADRIDSDGSMLCANHRNACGEKLDSTTQATLRVERATQQRAAAAAGYEKLFVWINSGRLAQ